MKLERIHTTLFTRWLTPFRVAMAAVVFSTLFSQMSFGDRSTVAPGEWLSHPECGHFVTRARATSENSFYLYRVVSFEENVNESSFYYAQLGDRSSKTSKSVSQDKSSKKVEATVEPLSSGNYEIQGTSLEGTVCKAWIHIDLDGTISFFTPNPSDPYGFTAWLNSVRQSYGLSPVGYDKNLESWAAMNSAQQASSGLGHYIMGPARRQNSAMGGYPGIETMWMNSPAHRSALLDPTIQWIGIAVYGAYWTFNAR